MFTAVILFELLLGNNWHILMDGFTNATGNFAARAYFIIFILISEVCCNMWLYGQALRWKGREDPEGGREVIRDGDMNDQRGRHLVEECAHTVHTYVCMSDCEECCCLMSLQKFLLVANDSCGLYCLSVSL